MGNRAISYSLIVAMGILMTTAAVAAPPLADRLPDDASFYVGWAGRNHALDGSLLGQLVSEWPTDEIAAAIRQGLDANINEQETREVVEHAMAMAAIVVRRPAALCVTDIPATAAAPIPDAALLIDLGADRQAFADHLDALLAIFADQLTWGDAATGSISYKTLQVGPGTPAQGYGYIGDMLFVTLGADMPGRIVAMADAADRSLLNAPKFSSAYKEVAGDDEQVVMYADVQAIAAMVGRIGQTTGELPPNLEMIVDALGLGKITAMVSATRIVDRQMYTKTRVLSPAPHEGVLMLWAGEPLKQALLAVAPADTILLVSFSIDPAALLAEIQRIVTTIEPKAGMQMNAGLMMASRQLGISIQDDLLAHMGDQFTLVSAPSLGGFGAGTALVVELKDEAAFAATVAKLETLAKTAMSADKARGGSVPTSFQVLKTSDATISYVQMPVVAPAWAIHDGRLIIAAWPQVVRAVIEGTGEPALIGESAFQEVLGRMADSPTFLRYINEPAILRRVNSLPLIAWTTLAAFGESEGFPLRAGWLPTLPTLLKYMRPSMSAASADATGVTSTRWVAIPIGAAMPILAAPPALAASILLPALGRARAIARDSVSMANLRAISTAVLMYQAENNGAAPADLDVLVREGLLGAKSLVSPTTGRRYEYIPLPEGAGGDMIMAYENPIGQRTGRRTPVAFGDGHIAMTPVDPSFWEAISRSKNTQGF